jgi:hypothetical protein
MTPPHFLYITSDTEFVKVNPGICIFWAFDRSLRRMVRYRSIQLGENFIYERL